MVDAHVMTGGFVLVVLVVTVIVRFEIFVLVGQGAEIFLGPRSPLRKIDKRHSNALSRGAVYVLTRVYYKTGRV